jgi:F-type H+-transporting ATPase subunit b
MQINLFPDLSLLAVMAIFLANYFVVSKFLVGPINRVLEERAHDAKSASETYESSLARFTEATTQIEERLRVARREASKVRDDFRADAATQRAGLIDKTSNEGKRLVGEAEDRLTKHVAAARERIVRDSESLARLAAERILGRAV